MQVMAMGTLVMCYNNIQVFRGVVQIRQGLAAKIIDRTRTMEDVYGIYYDFSCMLKSKVDVNDPNASETLDRLEIIMKTCRESGALNNRPLLGPPPWTPLPNDDCLFQGLPSLKPVSPPCEPLSLGPETVGATQPGFGLPGGIP
nr:squalene synthase-like [Ipomoea trifida]